MSKDLMQPGNEGLRQAIRWISEQRSDAGSKATMLQLVQEAAMRFNLSPLDEEVLIKTFATRSAPETP